MNDAAVASPAIVSASVSASAIMTYTVASERSGATLASVTTMEPTRGSLTSNLRISAISRLNCSFSRSPRFPFGISHHPRSSKGTIRIDDPRPGLGRDHLIGALNHRLGMTLFTRDHTCGQLRALPLVLMRGLGYRHVEFVVEPV